MTDVFKPFGVPYIDEPISIWLAKLTCQRWMCVTRITHQLFADAVMGS